LEGFLHPLLPWMGGFPAFAGPSLFFTNLKTDMELTRKQDVKRDEDIVVYDIYDCENVTVTAMKDAEENNEVVKVEAYDAYTTYAQWMEPGQGYSDVSHGYWEIDGGSLGD